MGRLKELYFAPFRLIAATARTFVRNRNRVRHLLSTPKVAATLKYGMVLTLMIWIAIFLLAREEDTKRLNDVVRSFWPKGEDRIPTEVESETENRLRAETTPPN